jgi:hypothetical protein
MQAEAWIRGQELTKSGEIEVHDYRVALGRVDLDGDRIFCEGSGGIFEG